MTHAYKSKYQPKLTGRFANMHNEVKIKNTSRPFNSASVIECAKAGTESFRSNLRAFSKEQNDAAKNAGR